MTEVEVKVLDFVRAQIEATAVSPTLTEIGRHMGWKSKGVAHGVIKRMVAEGVLARAPHAARGISLPDGPPLSAVSTQALQAELARRSGKADR